MRVLVACEESQTVCLAFRKLGHEAYSCDVLPTSGGHKEWHFQADVRFILEALRWDMVIAFPPCTHLANSGARWFADKQADGRQQQGINFFMQIVKLTASVPRVCIENPIGVMSKLYRKPTQIISPHQYGDRVTKKTCLWLKNLPRLKPTDIQPRKTGHSWIENGTGEARARKRSKTFRGVAEAMAAQWGSLDHSSTTKEEDAT